MALDVTVVVAQIVNFAVLVWLLNRFLYQPIRNMIRSREDQLRQRMEQALATESQARQALATYQEMQEELQRERGRFLEEAREEARREKSRLLEAAAQEAQQARRQFAEALNAQRMELASSIQENLVRQVCDTSGLILSHLVGTSLADAIISTLEERWQQQAHPAAGLATAEHHRALVRTSFPPTPEQKARLAALVERMQAAAAAGPDPNRREKPQVEFHVDPKLLLGVEVEIGGTAIAWSARDMLENLQKDALASLTTDPYENAVSHG